MPSSHSALHPRTCGWDAGGKPGSSRGAGSRGGSIVSSVPGHAWTCGSCVPPTPAGTRHFPPPFYTRDHRHFVSVRLRQRCIPRGNFSPRNRRVRARPHRHPPESGPTGAQGPARRGPLSGAWGDSAPSGFRLVHGARGGVPVRDGARRELQHPAAAPALVLGLVGGAPGGPPVCARSLWEVPGCPPGEAAGLQRMPVSLHGEREEARGGGSTVFEAEKKKKTHHKPHTNHVHLAINRK